MPPITPARTIGRCTVLALAALCGGSRASADEVVDSVVVEAAPARITRQERPFAFTVDPSTPSAGVFTAGYSFGVGSGIAADRPLPVNVATASGSHTLEAGYGITDRLAPFVSATFGDVGTSTSTQTFAAGLAWQVTQPGAPVRLSMSLAGMHEGASGSSGVTALAAASLDHGGFRLAGNLRGDKVFAAGRDALDYLVTLGASWRLTSAVRFGAEYVGQDLEELAAAGAAGGARQAAGPTLAFELDGGRCQVALGAGFGLNARSPAALARGTVAFNF